MPLHSSITLQNLLPKSLSKRRLRARVVINEVLNESTGAQDGNELDHLIGELVDSELDYVNDLQLCQNAYIRPLSATFDLSRIFTNWHQLIERHESALRCVYVESCQNEDSDKIGRVGYGFILETFQSLLNSIVDLYVDFCSRQLDATRQLEAKIASDIRFRQLVNESQRKLRKLIENGQNSTLATDGQLLDQNVERAQRNSNLPLTTFLLKPMQRITKYELLFDRMLKSLPKERHKSQLQSQLNELKRSAQSLCRQVNEACRLKEDDQDNSRRLKWCQSHILQQAYQSFEQPQVRPYSLGGGSPLAGANEVRLSGEFMRSQPPSDSLISLPNNIPLEQIQFESNTNCLGPRRMLKAGSMFKLSSSRELIVYLFNDFLLITQIKGGLSLQAEDVFKSDRARQAYYKFYRRPILLEDLELTNYTSDDQLGHQMPLLCHSIVAQPIKDQSDLVVSLLDRRSGSVYNLVALSQTQRVQWIEMLTEGIDEARRVRELQLGQSLIQAARRLNINECFGRLFVTVLELVKITSPKSGLTDDSNNLPVSLSRFSSSEQPELVQNLSIRLQLRLYKKASSILDDSERREIIAISDEFRTKTLVVCNATRQPTMVDMSHEMSMSVLDTQRDVYKFSELESTQFLLASAMPPPPSDGVEYLDVELVDDSLYRETRQLGRKRISLDQLLGRNKGANSGGQIDGNHLTRNGSLASSRRAMSIRSDRGVQPLQTDRPVEMSLKLKTLASTSNRELNGLPSRTATARLASNGRESGGCKYGPTVTKYNVKLRLHLQLFNSEPTTTSSLI